VRDGGGGEHWRTLRLMGYSSHWARQVGLCTHNSDNIVYISSCDLAYFMQLLRLPNTPGCTRLRQRHALLIGC
jgi:hypothetical protein